MHWLSPIILSILVVCSGCQTAAYYSQAVSGQAQILCCQESIEKLIADPHQPQAIVNKLKLVLELRNFARDNLDLNPGNNYLRYKALDRKYALWVVYAAPEFDVNLKSWWYPIAGRFTSRGWFNETSARKYANNLKREGLDVHIGGAPAYSTLGWFDDPVLSTFIKYSRTDLAELIFHELAHRRLFIADDATFNESFATATARAAVIRWLHSKSDAEGERRYRSEAKRMDVFVELVLQTRKALTALYKKNYKPDDMRKRKANVLSKLKARILQLHSEDPEYIGLAHWAKRPINNANLAAIAVYHRQVSAFEQLLANHANDLEKYFSAVEEITILPKEERKKKMQSLMNSK